VVGATSFSRGLPIDFLAFLDASAPKMRFSAQVTSPGLSQKSAKMPSVSQDSYK
jgi:hypothetical protein